MKSNFQSVKEEVSSIVMREREAEASTKQQEANCRQQYESAQQQMSAALASGDKDQYKAAGLIAEEARLELEFYEKSRAAGRKPAATPDDDIRIDSALNAEVRQIRTDTLNKLKAMFTDAASVCREAQNQLNEINDIYTNWKRIVMKTNNTSNLPTTDAGLAIASFLNVINGQLQRFSNMGGS